MPTDWSDIEGRIQYAYYTDDARALHSVLSSLNPKPVEGEEAVKLEPKNPRVRLVEALAAFDRAGKDAAARAAAVQMLRAVTEMFEAARAGASTTPEWGAAEAYAFLGRALFDQRDVVGAREALERALLIAPDYGFARRVMAQITR